MTMPGHPVVFGVRPDTGCRIDVREIDQKLRPSAWQRRCNTIDLLRQSHYATMSTRYCHVNPLRKPPGNPVLAGYDAIAVVHELNAADRNRFIVDLDMRCR